MQALADAVVPADRPGLDARPDGSRRRQCRPATPRCADCPAVAWCAFAAGSGRPAGPPQGARRPRRPAPAFPSTTRWLRGRVLDLARDSGRCRGSPTRKGSERTAHAVREAVLALADEGLLEARDGWRAGGAAAALIARSRPAHRAPHLLARYTMTSVLSRDRGPAGTAPRSTRGRCGLARRWTTPVATYRRAACLASIAVPSTDGIRRGRPELSSVGCTHPIGRWQGRRA